jgi:hypothetical protein
MNLGVLIQWWMHRPSANQIPDQPRTSKTVSINIDTDNGIIVLAD